MPNRWTLELIRDAFGWLTGYTLSGVWRYLSRHGIRLRSSWVEHFSPDPLYQDKLAEMDMVLWEARRYPKTVACVFLDQMSFRRWPEPGCDWGLVARQTDPQQADHGLWRLMGALDPFQGKVLYLDNYIVGRRQIIQMYGKLAQAYPQAKSLYAIQDNWSVHKHPDVLRALQQKWPQIQPVWLPTYAPWLNPIEKLWRWLKQDVLKMHRLAADWDAARHSVRKFLNQFANGSRRLLEYVGLLGNGRIAQMVRGP